MAVFLGQHKIISGFIGAAVLLFLVTLGFLNWMFEESNVREVKSIAHQVEASSVMGVFARPDDETNVTGLLVRAAKDEAIETSALTATRGEAGTQVPQVARQKDLAWVRKAEALKNTWALGVDHHEVLNFPDGGLEDVPIDILASAVRDRMVKHKAELIVTFWPESGLSGHPDHRRMGLAAEEAIKQLKVNPVEGYAGPQHIAYVLAPTRMMGRFVGELGRFIVANQPPANYAQSGETKAKLRGWKIHASQRDYVKATYGMPDWFLYRLYDKEFYYLLDTGSIPER